MVDVRTAKKNTRSLVRARRRELVEGQDETQRAAHGTALAEAFLAWLREYAEGLGHADLAGLTVTAFDPMPTEPPVGELAQAARDVGMRVLLPITVREGRTLRWVNADDPEGEQEGPEALLEVDIALIPGLAVDTDGYRLGQGGGYYDGTLPVVRPGVPIIVALHDHELPGSATAVVDSVPHEGHDILVDGVLTTAGVTWVRRDSPNSSAGR